MGSLSLSNSNSNSNSNIYVLLVLYFTSLSRFRSHAQLLPAQEVQTLRTISSKLNNNYWKTLDQSSCSRSQDFNKTFRKHVFSNVSCDCSFNNESVCHVTHMYHPILVILIAQYF